MRVLFDSFNCFFCASSSLLFSYLLGLLAYLPNPRPFQFSITAADSGEDSTPLQWWSSVLQSSQLGNIRAVRLHAHRTEHWTDSGQWTHRFFLTSARLYWHGQKERASSLLCWVGLFVHYELIVVIKRNVLVAQ